MRVYSDISLSNFEGWSGAEDTLARVENAGLMDALETTFEELYPDGMSETELNDILRFDADSVYGWVGLKTEDELREEIQDLEIELDDLKEEMDDEMQEILDDNGYSNKEEASGEVMRQIEEMLDGYKDDIADLEERINDAKEELAEIA